MTINKTILRKSEHTYGRSFPSNLKKYLLVKYAQDTFPFEFTEQDLYANIHQNILDYEADELDVAVKSPSDHWQEEREHLQRLYIEKSRETRDLEKYIAELEQMLLEQGLEPSRMSQRRTQF